jgi:hypothetical protein
MRSVARSMIAQRRASRQERPSYRLRCSRKGAFRDNITPFLRHSPQFDSARVDGCPTRPLHRWVDEWCGTVSLGGSFGSGLDPDWHERASSDGKCQVNVGVCFKRRSARIPLMSL